MSQPYRDTSPAGGGHAVDYELQDYYDDTAIPPPHRLSGFNNLAYSGTPASSSSFDLQSHTPPRSLTPPQSHIPTDAATRGAYTQPIPAAESVTAMPLANEPNYYEVGGTQSHQSPWLEKQKSTNKRSKWMVIGGAIVVVAIIVIGVAVGVTVSKKKSSGSTSSDAVKQSDPNDPSTFEKDSRLHLSFYGLAYTPEGSQLPNCGAKLSDVITDIQLMSQLTTRIRLYGADCNQTALTLEAIKQTKVNMTVYLGNYAVPNDNNAAYDRQRSEINAALQTYGTDHVAGITVGNEFMLNYLNANGATDPNGDVGNQGAALLTADIDDTKSNLTTLSLSKTLPIGTADAGSYFNTLVLEDVAYGMSNVHPWFANQSAENAAGWTAEFFQTTNVAPAQALSNAPQMFIAETGWPTQSSDAGNANNGASGSPASEASLQTFLDTFVCQANTNGTGYFFFEYFDEPWKDAQFGGVEGWWGLFHSNRTLKHIDIPNCPLS